MESIGPEPSKGHRTARSKGGRRGDVSALKRWLAARIVDRKCVVLVRGPTVIVGVARRDRPRTPKDQAPRQRASDQGEHGERQGCPKSGRVDEWTSRIKKDLLSTMVSVPIVHSTAYSSFTRRPTRVKTMSCPEPTARHSARQRLRSTRPASPVQEALRRTLFEPRREGPHG